MVLFVAAITACEKHSPAEPSARAQTKQSNPTCEKVQKLPDDIETQTCVFHTNTLQSAYTQIASELNANQAKTSQLRSELPASNAEDSFDEAQLWVAYQWLSKTEVMLTVTTEGEENEFLLKQVNNEIQVRKTRALQ